MSGNKPESGGINIPLLAGAAGVVLAIVAIFYANSCAKRLDELQATVDKLQQQVTAQEESINRMGLDSSELQSALQGQDLRLQSVEQYVANMKEEARKRAAAAAAAAKAKKAPVKKATKPAPKKKR